MISIHLKTTVLIVMLVGAIVISMPSCTHDPMGIEGMDPVCFDTQVLDILQTSCGMAGCHDGSAEGFLTTDYQSVMNAVTPGDPRGSELYKVITAINSDDMMPPDRPLTQWQRTIIAVWIAQGANEVLCDTSSGGNGGGTKSCSDSIYFAQKILPLFTTQCAWCHDGGPHGDEDHLFRLNSYETIRPYVNPSSPSSSEAYKVLSASGDDRMPPPDNPPVNSTDKKMLLTWITEGAVNNSCTGNTCDTSGTITYSGQIEPIMQHNCTGCHTSPNAQGGIDLVGYAQVKTQAQILRPNSPGGTPVLLGVVRRTAGFKSMPTTYALDECSIRNIELWIEQGLLP